MKCISLWQPWATFWMLGIKQSETRSWATSHRGPIAVHAALRWTTEQRNICLMRPFSGQIINMAAAQTRKLPAGMAERFELEDVLPFILPRGVIIGTLHITGCDEITAHNTPGSPEFNYGDWTPGRFAWRADTRRPFENPIPFKGGQRIFNVPDELLRGAA